MLGLKLNHVSKSGHWWFGMWIIQLFNSKLKMMIKILLIHVVWFMIYIHVCLSAYLSQHLYMHMPLSAQWAGKNCWLHSSSSWSNQEETLTFPTPRHKTQSYLILVRSYRLINIAIVQILPYHVCRNGIQLFTQQDTFGIRTRSIYTSICFIARK